MKVEACDASVIKERIQETFLEVRKINCYGKRTCLASQVCKGYNCIMSFFQLNSHQTRINPNQSVSCVKFQKGWNTTSLTETHIQKRDWI